MTTMREAAQQALEAMESVEWYGAGSGWMVDADAIEGAITALRAALAEPVQEPVAWMTHGNDLLPLFHRTRAGALAWGAEPQPLYTAPPQRKPLTEEEIEIICKKAREDAEAGWPHGPNYVLLTIRAIERAHGIGGNDEPA